jgi:hypothetical protein
MRSTPPLPARLHLLNLRTLTRMARTISACTRAIRNGDQVQGMDTLIVLDTLAELLDDVATRDR